MKRAVTLLLVVATLGLSACGSASDDEKRLRAALQRTERLSHLFIYDEAVQAKTGDQHTVVRGLVEDDFRYKARVALEGRPVLDEVVTDDTLAVRFLDPSRIGDFLRKPTKQEKEKEKKDTPPPTSQPTGPAAAEVLATRRWVLDPAGAPAVFGSPDDERLLGDDPVLDALDVFSYVERAIDEAVRITVFNPESLEYRPDEDPFDTPKERSGVTRYDFVRPELPKAADASAGGNQVTPDTRHFRKLSVYVKGGLVIQVREKVDVESRLKDLAEIYDAKFPANRPKAEVAAIAVEALNAIRQGQGQDPIRLRDMRLSLKDLGSDVKVALPGEVTKASLALLENRGRPAAVADGTAEAVAVAEAAEAAALAAQAPPAAAPPAPPATAP